MSVERQVHTRDVWTVQVFCRHTEDGVGYWKDLAATSTEKEALNLVKNLKIRILQDAHIEYGEEEMRGDG